MVFNKMYTIKKHNRYNKVKIALNDISVSLKCNTLKILLWDKTGQYGNGEKYVEAHKEVICK